MLLHTSGSTKVGQVRRYTVTYTPSHDQELPLPTALHLRIKNTAALPFRAAYLHGPYTLYVSVRRQEFQPWPSRRNARTAVAAEDQGPLLDGGGIQQDADRVERKEEAEGEREEGEEEEEEEDEDEEEEEEEEAETAGIPL